MNWKRFLPFSHLLWWQRRSNHAAQSTWTGVTRLNRSHFTRRMLARSDG